MFARKKKNRSGTVSVVVIDKSNDRFCELKTIGVSSDQREIERLYFEGKRWLSVHLGYRAFEQNLNSFSELRCLKLLKR